MSGLSWAILVKTVKNDQELDKFIKEKYGKDCALGEKKQSSQMGVFDISINNTGNIDPGEGCFLNWILFVKYSPENNKVASWDMGQDVNFVLSDKVNEDVSYQYYDMEMAESFKFIK